MTSEGERRKSRVHRRRHPGIKPPSITHLARRYRNRSSLMALSAARRASPGIITREIFDVPITRNKSRLFEAAVPAYIAH